MKKPVKTILVFLLLPALLLAACTPSNTPVVEAPASPSPQLEPTVEVPAAPLPAATTQAEVNDLIPRSGEMKILDNGKLAQKDSQGAVTVVITPLELSEGDDTLAFDVVMDTHSVDLSMDLSDLATLTTDTGKSIPPSEWDAPVGGHHVSGKLIFPAVLDNAHVLEGASAITLVLREVDAPERVFTWPLTIE